MPSLDDLKKRITSVKSTQKITKAMKMVAAAKLKRAQESAEKGRPFSEKMNNIILNLSNSISDKDNASKFLVGTGKDDIHLCVVITADRGLCGGFNTNICRKAKNYFEKILKYTSNTAVLEYCFETAPQARAHDRELKLCSREMSTKLAIDGGPKACAAGYPARGLFGADSTGR